MSKWMDLYHEECMRSDSLCEQVKALWVVLVCVSGLLLMVLAAYVRMCVKMGAT